MKRAISEVVRGAWLGKEGKRYVRKLQVRMMRRERVQLVAREVCLGKEGSYNEKGSG